MPVNGAVVAVKVINNNRKTSQIDEYYAADALILSLVEEELNSSFSQESDTDRKDKSSVSEVQQISRRVSLNRSIEEEKTKVTDLVYNGLKNAR